MTHVVFVGPSLPPDQVRALHPSAVIYPPVRQGDIVSVLREHQPTAIGIIDGVFLDVLSVWHKEILLALDEGVEVYGAASMGALRAAECAPFGMVGVGRIFQMYADGTLTRDDEVAVAHATAEFDHRSVSEPLVNIRLNLAEAAEQGVLDQATSDALLAEAAGVYFPDRSWPRVFSSELLTDESRDSLRQFVREMGVDHKAADARAMLELMARRAQTTTDGIDNTAAETTAAETTDAEPAEPWTLEKTHYLDALVQRDRWSRRNGEPISQEAIAKFALVNDPAAQGMAGQALLELLALFAARHLGLEPHATEVATYRKAFLATRGVSDEAGLAEFCVAHDLTLGEFEELMTEQATLKKATDWLLLTRFKLGVVQPLLDAYRIQGNYHALADAAAFAQSVNGRGEDGLPARVELPNTPATEQVQRHSAATGWHADGLTLLEWSQRHGFVHDDALLIEIERSRRARAVATAAQAAAKGMQ